MNPIEIVNAVAREGASLGVTADGELLIRGRGEPLSESLQAELREHRTEVLVALGVPIDRAVASILADLRPHLPPALRRLPDDRLLALVNWTIMASWEQAIRRVR